MMNVMSVGDDDPTPSLVPGLYWGVRSSFVGYVLGNPDGDVFGEDGVETDGQGQFRFPFAGGERVGDEYVLRFGGDLVFTAHGGFLTLRLLHPVVRVGPEGGTLAVGEKETVIATLASGTPASVADWLVFPPLETALAEAGVALFGDVYETGEALDPLRVAVPAEAAA